MNSACSLTDASIVSPCRIHLSRSHQRERSQFSCRLVSFATSLTFLVAMLTHHSIAGGLLGSSSSKCFTAVLPSKARTDTRHSATFFATNPLSPIIPLRLLCARASSSDCYARTNTNEWEVKVELVKSNNTNGSRASIGDC